MDSYSPLMALSPLDGRYRAQVAELREIFSEFGLIKRRVALEVAWLMALCGAPGLPQARALSDAEQVWLWQLADGFTLEDAQRIKEIEATTNHDVKAVEYFIKERLVAGRMADLVEFVHFACTSEDVNNVAHALMLRDGLRCLRKAQVALGRALADFSARTRAVPMLARTHGQPASPTTLGKEMAVFAARLSRQEHHLDALVLPAKLNGAVGNYNAHFAAAPEVDWPEVARQVIEVRFGLEQNRLTTQIEPHDGMAELFHAMMRWNNVLLDFNRDIWSYIAMGYLGQRSVKGEVGSSTMPHKINPIDFENSEGNLGLANAVLQHLADKLTVSRLQRDLSDSTVLRNMGVGFAHTLMATLSSLKGLGKLRVVESRMAQDLDSAWEVLGEAVQSVMRRFGLPEPYERLKEFTRGERVTAEVMRDFITALELPATEKERLLALTPASYTGIAAALSDIPGAGERE